MQVDSIVSPEFPLLTSGQSLHRKTYRLSQELSNEKPFDIKYSNKIKKRISKSSNLGTFIHKKPVKLFKNVDLAKLMQKIKDSEIVTFKGRKREIPKRNLTRLKKNILRIRAENAEKQKAVSDINTLRCEEPLKPEMIESLKSLKVDHELNVGSNGSILCKNPFQDTKKIVQHSRQFRSSV